MNKISLFAKLRGVVLLHTPVPEPFPHGGTFNPVALIDNLDRSADMSGILSLIESHVKTLVSTREVELIIFALPNEGGKHIKGITNICASV